MLATALKRIGIFLALVDIDHWGPQSSNVVIMVNWLSGMNLTPAAGEPRMSSLDGFLTHHDS